jgi:prepilin-type N-terminal cleavage/methylation domain-containing protein/prepilin-type processing-associated H-X9-DG protein
MKTFAPRRSSAFTLVELLVVIGIIAVLVSLLMPVLAKVRESAKQVTCSSNLRALGTAMLMYANDNDGFLPATSQAGKTNEDPADWIWWQPDRASSAPDLTALLRQSALAKYLQLTAANIGMLRCPSDNFGVHTGFQNNIGAMTPYGDSYPYSYVMNCFIASDSIVTRRAARSAANGGLTFRPWPGPNPPAFDKSLTRSLHKIINPSQKALMYEQSELTIDDGEGVPFHGASTPPSATAQNWGGCLGNIDLLSVRHDPRRIDTSGEKSTDGTYDDAVPFKDARGNVVFCDGHVDFVTRSYLHEPEHTLGSY